MDENSIDNSRLEKLMMKEITPQMQREVLEILKESQLFMPVDFGSGAFEGLENAKPGDVVEGPKGFSILYLTDNNGTGLFLSLQAKRCLSVQALQNQ